MMHAIGGPLDFLPSLPDPSPYFEKAKDKAIALVREPVNEAVRQAQGVVQGERLATEKAARGVIDYAEERAAAATRALVVGGIVVVAVAAAGVYVLTRTKKRR